MKITVEFDNWDEMEAFRTSGKKTRTKKEEEAEQPAQQVAQAAQPQAFIPPQVPISLGFPGAAQPVAANPLVAAINAKIDQVIAGGQKPDDIVNWFRQQIGPDAAQATLDQIKNIFVPRIQEPALSAIAKQLGIG